MPILVTVPIGVVADPALDIDLGRYTRAWLYAAIAFAHANQHDEEFSAVVLNYASEDFKTTAQLDEYMTHQAERDLPILPAVTLDLPEFTSLLSHFVG